MLFALDHGLVICRWAGSTCTTLQSRVAHIPAPIPRRISIFQCRRSPCRWTTSKTERKAITPLAKHGSRTSQGKLSSQNLIGGRWSPLEARLASKSSPTVLYEGPSKTVYVLGCYAMGFSCFAYTGYQVYDIFVSPAYEIPKWIKTSMAGICAIALLSGVYFFSKTFCIARTISAAPVVSRNGQTSLQLQIRSGHVFPRTTTVNVAEASTSDPLFIPSRILSRTEKAEEAVARRERYVKEKERLYTLPFRDMAKAFKSFQQMLFDTNWVYLQIQGHLIKFKIDKHPTWALENGKVLDALIYATKSSRS